MRIARVLIALLWFQFLPVVSGGQNIRIADQGFSLSGGGLDNRGGKTSDARMQALGAAAAGNATVNNYLTHDQWNQYAKDLANCKAQGCSKEEEAQIRNKWESLSTEQNIALANCDTGGNCGDLWKDVVDGTNRMNELVKDGKIPGGAVQNDLGQYQGQRLATDPVYRQQVSDARKTVEACNANPSQCNEQALRVAAVVLTPIIAPVIGNAAFTQMLVNSGKMAASEIALLYQLGTVNYCALRLQGCMVVIETAAGLATNSTAPSVVPSGKVPGVRSLEEGLIPQENQRKFYS